MKRKLKNYYIGYKKYPVNGINASEIKFHQKMENYFAKEMC